MNLLKFFAGIFQPVADMVDDLVLSAEEKEQFKLAVLQAQFEATYKLMEYEQKLLEAQQDIITTEARSNSWLTRSWRPITMLTFLTLVVADQTGMLAFRLAPEAWGLLELGLGGYVIGRSVEKVAPKVLDALRDK